MLNVPLLYFRIQPRSNRPCEYKTHYLKTQSGLAMFYRHLLIILLTALSIQSTYANQEKPAEVYINIAENWATADGRGFAYEMFTRISDLAGMPNKLIPTPAKRIHYLMSHGEGDCLFALDENKIENFFFSGQIDFISSLPFTEDSIHAFTLKSEPKIRQKSDFIGKKTVLSSASADLLNVKSKTKSYFADIDVDYEIIDETSKSLQALLMLKNHRADIFVRYRGAIKQQEKEAFHYDPDFLIFESKDTLNCRNTAEMERYITQFNVGIRKGIEENLLDDLYKKYKRIKPVLKTHP